MFPLTAPTSGSPTATAPITVLNASDGSYAFGTDTSPIDDPDGAAYLSSDGTHVWIANGDGTVTVLNASRRVLRLWHRRPRTCS